MHRKKLEPKIVQIFREGYSLKTFTNDLTAGIIVGIVALPLSIAFAIASGVKPEQGLYTAIVAGFLVSVLSGSRVQIGGPTGAFIVIIYGVVQQYGYSGLAVATLMSGVILILMGVAKLGDVIKFIPYPVTVGFTSGIALIIFTSQIRDFFGLTIASVPADFVDKCVAYTKNFHTLNFHAIGLGAATLLIIGFWPKISKRIPGSLIAIIVTTLAVKFLSLPVETIGSRFGEVATSLPAPHLPNISRELIIKMFPVAVTIALLAAIESLLAAVVADGMTGRRHRSNMELIAQGVANIASPLWGGIPATGAIARTATNIKNGGTTPIAGVIHAITLLLILLFFGKWAALIPMATLAGILIVVAFNMSEWHLFVKLLRSPRSDIAVLVTTLLLTVFVDLTVAIEVGVLLAVFLFIRRMVEATQVGYVTDELIVNKLFGDGIDTPSLDYGGDEDEQSDPNSISQKHIPLGVEVFEIYGPFFFGAADKFKDTFLQIEKPPKILILRMRHVPVIDATGIRALEDVLEKMKKKGIVAIISGIHDQPLHMLERSGLMEYLDKDNIVHDIDDAISRARQILKQTQ
jgi:SulP family sulfate permease